METLKIYYANINSPREDENLGTFITIDRNYNSPDTNKEYSNIIQETSEQADNRDHHIKLIKREIEKTGEKISLIVSVCKYEHSAVHYSVGYQKGWDCSNNGFYIVTQSDLKRLGLSKWTRKEKLIKTIESELETYTHWCNGEVYGYNIEDENGEEIHSMWGLIGLDELVLELPEEYKEKDLQQYFKY